MTQTRPTKPAETIDLAALRAATLQSEPYEHMIVPGFVPRGALPAINADFPDVRQPGSLPTTILSYGAGFGALIDALQGPEMQAAMAEKFGVDLTGRPTMVTVRGHCRARDGGIHTDSRDKIITVLVYLNDGWDTPDGRLRILRSGTDLEDYAAEVPPEAGTLLAFRRSDRSWHGHTSFEGPRRAVQLNWVTSNYYVWKERARHTVSALFKSRHAA